MSGSLAYGCIYVRSIEVATSVRQFIKQIKLEMEPSRSEKLRVESSFSSPGIGASSKCFGFNALRCAACAVRASVNDEPPSDAR